MKFVQSDRILHIIFNDKSDLTEIIAIADRYEGKMKQRQGFNFPMNIVRDFLGRHCTHSLFTKYLYSADYVIAYKDGDILTKKHELQHAKYFCDRSFVDKVRVLWESFPVTYQKRATSMLLKMGYPADKIMDEFQAYYFTEKSSFFGKIA